LPKGTAELELISAAVVEKEGVPAPPGAEPAAEIDAVDKAEVLVVSAPVSPDGVEVAERSEGAVGGETFNVAKPSKTPALTIKRAILGMRGTKEDPAQSACAASARV